MAPDPVLLFLLPKKQILVVSTMEQGRADRECYSSVEVLTPEALLFPKKRWDIVEQIQAVATRARIKTLKWGSTSQRESMQIIEKGWKVELSQKPNCPAAHKK